MAAPHMRNHNKCSPNIMLDKMKLQLGDGQEGKVFGLASVRMWLREEGQVHRLRRRGPSQFTSTASPCRWSVSVEK